MKGRPAAPKARATKFGDWEGLDRYLSTYDFIHVYRYQYYHR